MQKEIISDTRRRNTQRAVSAVLDLYLAGADAVTVKQIAEHADMSPAVVRKACNDAFEIDNGWNRIVPTEAVVDVYGRDFRNYIGQRVVPAWTVSKRWLARQLVALNNAASNTESRCVTASQLRAVLDHELQHALHGNQ